LAELKELDYGLSEIGDAASRLVVMARKLMKGKPFRVLSNDPEITSRVPCAWCSN
jgi:hypothetical protein